MIRNNSTEKKNEETLPLPINLPCCCKEPVKKYSKSGCYVCWVCETCGRFGGCDNSRAIAVEKGITGIIVPFIRDVVKCEHHWHLVSNGEIKTVSPCYYQVACCKCATMNDMMVDEPGCKFSIKWNDKTVMLGPTLKGKLLRKEEE